MVNTIELSLIFILCYNVGIMLESLYFRICFEYGLFYDWFLVYYMVSIQSTKFNGQYYCVMGWWSYGMVYFEY